MDASVVERILVTFVEGFFTAWAVTGFRLDKVVLGGAVGAGISLVYNVLVKPVVVK